MSKVKNTNAAPNILRLSSYALHIPKNEIESLEKHIEYPVPVEEKS